jgi:hypothetical protein
MAKNHLKDSHLTVVDTQMDHYSAKIGESIGKLLHDERADPKKIVTLLCTGIIGLAVSTCRRQGLIQKNAKDELTRFVAREMERVRKQHGLRKNDVYRK